MEWPNIFFMCVRGKQSVCLYVYMYVSMCFVSISSVLFCCRSICSNLKIWDPKIATILQMWPDCSIVLVVVVVVFVVVIIWVSLRHLRHGTLRWSNSVQSNNVDQCPAYHFMCVCLCVLCVCVCVPMSADMDRIGRQWIKLVSPLIFAFTNWLACCWSVFGWLVGWLVVGSFVLVSWFGCVRSSTRQKLGLMWMYVCVSAHNWPDELPSLSLGDVDAGLDESEWMDSPAEFGGGEVESDGIRPSFIRFFCFIRLFWNHILTCVSFNCNEVAISIRRARVRYLLKWNSFSNSVSCLVVKLVRPVLLAALLPTDPGPPMPPPPTPPGPWFVAAEFDDVNVFNELAEFGDPPPYP